MRLITTLIALALLAACDPGYRPRNFAVLPDELKDCKFYRVNNEVSSIDVVRCPNSSTTSSTSNGKTTTTTVVIDGVEYTRKEN